MKEKIEKKKEFKNNLKNHKAMQKKKITKTMKKYKVEYFSTEFSACLLGSPFGYGSMLSKAGVRQCQMLSTSDPQKPGQSCK